MQGHSKVANGNIAPMRFVKGDTTADGKVLQAGAGDRIYGISGRDTRYPPYSSLDDGFHAIAGETCLVYGQGETKVHLELGGTVTRFDYLKADANGKGVTATADQDDYGAIAQASGVSGDIVLVDVHLGERSTT